MNSDEGMDAAGNEKLLKSMLAALDLEVRALEQGRKLLTSANPGLLHQARETMGSERGAALWLLRPQRALGGKIPVEVAVSPEGLAKVQQVMGAIGNGVFL